MRSLCAVLSAAILFAACDKNPEPPPTPDPGTGVPSGTEKITGTERIGWDQQAGSTEELATFRYLIYVDANATDVQDVRCTTTPGPAGYVCTARLPPMSTGQHSLSLSSYITNGGSRLESPRSPSFSVVLIAQSTTSSAGANSVNVTTVDGVQLHGSLAADGLVDPTDVAAAPDGRLFIAERSGRIRVFRDGRLQPVRATALPDVTTRDGQGLLALAVDPSYLQNRFIYAIYTTAAGFRLVRLRIAGDTLGDRAILLDRVTNNPSHPAAALRFGPDGKLYAGFDDGGDAVRAGDLGSFNGKILRLNTDGTTPRDQPSGSPIYTANLTAPKRLDWDLRGTLWVADAAAEGVLNAYSRSPLIRYRLPGGASVSALAIYRGNVIKQFEGDLLVALSDGRSLVRLKPDSSDATRIAETERLLGDEVAAARAIAVATDGSIYIATATALFRLAPQG